MIGPAVRRFNCFAVGHARRAEPQRRRCGACRRGWRCGRSITKPEGSMPSSAASRRRRRRRRSCCPRMDKPRFCGGAAERAGEPEGRPRSATASREEGGGAAPADSPRRQCAAGAVARRSRRSRRCRRRSTCSPRRAPPQAEAAAASTAGADAAGRQSAAAFQLAQHNLPPDSDRPQECLVVADGDQRAVRSSQRIFKLLDRGEIEMVGRLVQQQEERRLRACERRGETRAQPLAAAERGRDLQRRPVTERKPRQRRVSLVSRKLRIRGGADCRECSSRDRAGRYADRARQCGR